MNLFTGKASAYPLSLGPLWGLDPIRIAWTPDGWLDWSSNTVQAGGFSSGSLTRNVVHESKVTSTVLIDDINRYRIAGEVSAQSDGAGVRVWSPLATDGGLMQRLGLITCGNPGIETVTLLPYDREGLADAFYVIYDYALSPSTVSWVVTTVTRDSAGLQHRTYELHQRARKGGAITTPALPAGYDGEPIVAAEKRVATIEASSPNEVQIFDGHGWHAMSLPGAAAGLVGTGYNFVTAVSGPSPIAGTYQIKTTGDARRVATASGPDPTS